MYPVPAYEEKNATPIVVLVPDCLCSSHTWCAGRGVAEQLLISAMRRELYRTANNILRCGVTNQMIRSIPEF